MNKKTKVIIATVLGIIIFLLLLHLGKEWLIPMIIRMHSGSIG